MNLEKIAVKGIGPFSESVSFKIPKGLSVIYGLNRSAGKNSKNSNWCGKSLFFSTIPEVLYDEPIVGTKQDKIKKGLQGLVISHNNKTLKIIQKNNKLSLSVNGEKQDLFTKTKAKEIIQSFWPLSQEEYETFVHLDSRIPHPLVMGSTADRKNFFSSFFGLDKLDAERKLYQEALRELSRVKAAYQEVKATYVLLKKDFISKEEIQKMLSEKTSLEKEYEALRKEFIKAQEKQRLLDIIKTIKDKIPILEKKGIFSQEDLVAKISQIEIKIEEVSENIEKVRNYNYYKKTLAKYNEIYNQLSKLAKNTSENKLKEGNSRYQKALSQKDILFNKLRVLQKTEKPTEIEDPCFDYGELVEKKNVLSHQLKHAKTFKTGVCPTCGQSVRIKDPSVLEKQLKEVSENLNKVKEYKNYLEEKEQYEAIIKQCKDLEEQLNDQIVLVNKYKKYSEAYKEVLDLPTKPEEMSFDLESDDIEIYNTQKSKLEKQLGFYNSIKPYMRRIEDYRNLEDKTYPKLDITSVNKVSDRIAVLNTKINFAKDNAEKLLAIKKRLIDMKDKLKDEKALQILSDIYSDKQIKKQVIQIIGNRLMGLVNKYAAIVFNEDYRFELVWDTQIHLICKRRAGENLLVSDVRKLSGAESKLFTIILVLSLLSFVPKEKRPNVMILDEPTANFSSETTRCFQDLLKLLSQLIESIVIITPRSEDIYEGSHCFTVLREGTSKIVPGHPDTL